MFGVLALDPVEIGSDVLRVRPQTQVIAHDRPALNGGVMGDIVEVEDATALQDGTHVRGEVPELSGDLRLGDAADPALRAEAQVLVIGAPAMTARLEEQPLVQLRPSRTAHVIGLERHPVAVPPVILVEPGHELDANPLRPVLLILEQQVADPTAPAQVLLEGVVPDARDELQGAHQVRLARAVGADEHGDVRRQLQLQVPDRSEPLDEEVLQSGSHAVSLTARPSVQKRQHHGGAAGGGLLGADVEVLPGLGPAQVRDPAHREEGDPRARGHLRQRGCEGEVLAVLTGLSEEVESSLAGSS